MNEALGVGKGERTEARLGYRSGHHPRTGLRTARRMAPRPRLSRQAAPTRPTQTFTPTRRLAPLPP
jgi:hypothetical protein